MILYGAGGHAKVVYDSLVSQGIKLIGIFDDNSQIKIFYGVRVINPYNPREYAEEEIIISIGSNKSRFQISSKVRHLLGITIHASAYVSENAQIKAGAMVMAKTVIQPDTIIGEHSIVNTGAIIEHGSKIDDFVHIGPGAVVCGDVKIGRGTFIGANATILPGISIGEWSTIGAGTLVNKNVEKNVKVVGNPARIISN